MPRRDAVEPSLAEVRRLSPSSSLAGRGAGALREMILGGILAPGERLNEVAVSTALGISRAPLREAIRDLASQGLLTIVTHKGAFVPNYTADDLRDLYEVRIAIESHGARLLAVRKSPADLAELSDLLDQPGDPDFHGRVIELTGNRQLMAMSTAVGQKLQLARLRFGLRPESAGEARAEHGEIVGAIGSDPEAAAMLMLRHLQLSLAGALRHVSLSTA